MSDHDLKLLVIGSQGVGKSSLVLKYCDDVFGSRLTQATIGVDLKTKRLKIGNERCKVTFWDTAGLERYRAISSAYYRDIQGILIVYDVCNRETFEDLEYWIRESTDQCERNSEMPIRFVLGNKIDKENERQVEASESMAFLDQLGHENGGDIVDGYFEVTATNKTEVKSVIHKLITTILQTRKLNKRIDSGTVNLSQPSKEDVTEGGCFC